MELLTRDEVAQTLKVHPDSAFGACRRMGVPVLRLGHRTSRVRRTDLEAGIERLARPEAPVRSTHPLRGKTARAGVSTGPRRQR